jgi:hypothetical protein
MQSSIVTATISCNQSEVAQHACYKLRESTDSASQWHLLDTLDRNSAAGVTSAAACMQPMQPRPKQAVQVPTEIRLQAARDCDGAWVRINCHRDI